MKKFYIYKAKKKDGKLAFVYDLEEFVKNEFNPLEVDFLGIMIEAENLQKAITAYMNPSNNESKIYSVEEPVNTSKLRKLSKTILNEQLIIKFSKTIKTLIEQNNIILHNIAQIMSAHNNKRQEDIYLKLKEFFIEKLNSSK